MAEVLGIMLWSCVVCGAALWFVFVLGMLWEALPKNSHNATTTPHHPQPWWYHVAARYFPDRCREIPEARNPERIVLRQFALIKRYAYLQQFASSEDPGWAHSHQWRYTVALGLWGSYTETRLAGWARRRCAPYLFWMDATVIHQVSVPSVGHTSIFIGLFRDDDLKHYYPVPAIGRKHWEAHIK